MIGLPREAMVGIRSSTEPYALLLARTMRDNMTATWGVSETGAAGPTGNGYGDAAGHTCIAVAGPFEHALTVETGSSDREANMTAFAKAALEMLADALADDLARASPHADGRWQVKVEPAPGSLSRLTQPPCSSTSALTSASPRPGADTSPPH